MSNIVSISDFTGSYRIPNSSDVNMVSWINELITENENDLIYFVLGETLGTDVIANPDNHEELLNGLGKFKGLKFMIVLYVYYTWRFKSSKEQTSNGTSVVWNENSSSENITFTLVDVWNKLSDMSIQLDVYCKNKPIETYEKHLIPRTSWL